MTEKRFERDPELVLGDNWFQHDLDAEEVYRALEELYAAKRIMMTRPAEAYIYVDRAIEALEHA